VGRDLYAVLDQVLALLRRRGRVTYNDLKLQFNLDDAHLGVLKEELLYTYPRVADDQGRGLIWTSDESLLASPGVVHSCVRSTLMPAALWYAAMRLPRQRLVATAAARVAGGSLIGGRSAPERKCL